MLIPITHVQFTRVQRYTRKAWNSRQWRELRSRDLFINEKQDLQCAGELWKASPSSSSTHVWFFFIQKLLILLQHWFLNCPFYIWVAKTRNRLGLDLQGLRNLYFITQVAHYILHLFSSSALHLQSMLRFTPLRLLALAWPTLPQPCRILLNISPFLLYFLPLGNTPA